MNNPLKHIVVQFLNFSRSDRNAILILSVLILVVITANVIVVNLEQKPSVDSSDYAKIINEWGNESVNDESQVKSLFHFNPNTISESKLDSLQIPIFIKQNIINYRKAGGIFNSVIDFRKIYGVNDSIYNAIESFIEIAKEDLPKRTFKKKRKNEITGNFDPNKADFIELKEFGFSNYQANNLLKYRDKGGVIEEQTDLQKIYEIDSLFYSSIKEHVQIEKEINAIPKKLNSVYINIEINGADTTELVKLKGIGSVYARRIVKYRNLLGGFYSKEQLLEVYNFPEETFHAIKNQISIDTTSIKKIRINFAEYSDLLKHPYLNKKQVEGILDFRNKNGFFENISQIQAVDLLDEKTYMKMKPYFISR